MKTKPKQPATPECLVCNHVLSLKRPILYVVHDEDRVWKFTCRHIGHKMDQIKAMPLDKITQLDASVREIFEMPPGVGSKRSNVNNNWEPFLLYPELEEA
jgi:hypothetical protein